MDVSECGMDLSLEAFADRPCLGNTFENFRQSPHGTPVGCFLWTDRVNWASSQLLTIGEIESDGTRLIINPTTFTMGEVNPDGMRYATWMFIDNVSEVFCSTLSLDSTCENTPGCTYAIGPVPHLYENVHVNGRDGSGECIYSSADGFGVSHPEQCDGRDNDCDGQIDNIPACQPEPEEPQDLREMGPIQNVNPIQDPNRCEGSADCPNDRPICEDGLCVECIPEILSCADLNRPICGDDGTCHGCADSAECAHGTVCEAATGRCVECLSNNDCNSDAPFCNTDGMCEGCDPMRQDQCNGDASCLSNGSCGACQQDADCPDTLPRCDLETRQCVGCQDQDDCGVGLNCIDNICVECGEPGRNVSYCWTEGRPICDATTQRCRPCISTDECGDGYQCFEGGCVQCDPRTNQGCTDGRVCANSGQFCEQCESNRQCEDFYPDRPFCDPLMGCVTCEPGSNLGCSAEAPICNPDTLTCQTCNSDLECAADGTSSCVDGQCFKCVDDEQCGELVCAQISGSFECAACDPLRAVGDNGCDENRPFCSRLGQCGTCENNVACPNRTPVCDLDRATCRTCEADSECADRGLFCVRGQCRTCDAQRENPNEPDTHLGCTAEAPACRLYGTQCE